MKTVDITKYNFCTKQLKEALPKIEDMLESDIVEFNRNLGNVVEAILELGVTGAKIHERNFKNRLHKEKNN